MLSKYLGLLISLFMVMGALFQIGIFLYIDINSILIVFGGAFGYSLIQIKKKIILLILEMELFFLDGWEC